MRTDLEARIRAEIAQKEKTYDAFAQGDNEYACNSTKRYIAALEWVLSLIVSEPATAPQSDDEIVDMASAAYLTTPEAYTSRQSMRVALAVARPVIEREAQAPLCRQIVSQSEELDSLRAILARAGEAMEPFGDALEPFDDEDGKGMAIKMSVICEENITRLCDVLAEIRATQAGEGT